MPPVQIYAVDFSNGNLVPSLDVNGWGNMKQGVAVPSHPDNKAVSYADLKGLGLAVYRAPTSPVTVPSTINICVVPPPGALPLATRLSMRVEFDQPYAQLAHIPQPSAIGPQPPPTGTDWPSPWAVGLLVKSGAENEIATEPKIPVTCQFNRAVNGVRLNSPKPGSLQNDQPSNMDSPVNYSNYWNPPGNPPRFVLEFAFCGYDAVTAGHSVGSGSLSIGTKNDQRLFSSTALSTGAPPSIGSLAVALVTLSGVGQIMVRLRRFSVSLWK